MPAPSKKKQPVRNAVPPPEPPATHAGLKFAGAVCLLVAIVAAFMLALDHFALVTPPGCGPQSGCDRATKSAWGTIPIVNWPTSLAGVAYFSAMLAAWLASSRSIHPLLRGIAWLGVLGSIFFTIVMLTQGYMCKYCVATHVANIAFLIVMEIAARRIRVPAQEAPTSASVSARQISLTPVVAGLVVFLIATSALAITHQQTTARRLARSEGELRDSTDEIARRSAANSQANATTQSDAASTTQTAAAPPQVGPPNPNDVGPPRPDTDNTSTSAQKPFTGRYRLGPENAPIRIVMFMDYQCEDCQLMESQAAALLTRRSDVSLSVKQFPMCADCNPHIGGIRMHLNACWAARAAEAAGMLKGNDGFWQMHNWLFARRGSFTDADFPPALQSLGYDPQQFIDTMTSNATLQNVLADVAEGSALGLHFTPLIFINGVELRGFIGNPGALTRTVETLAAKNLPSGSPMNDHPAKAADKYIADWQSKPARHIPAPPRPHSLGDANAKVTITVFGDLQDSYTAGLDGVIQELLAARNDGGGGGVGLRYDFRHYPADRVCNASVQRTVYPSSCIAARAAEAAASVSGVDGEQAFWKMHRWLLAHPEKPAPAPPAQTPAPALTEAMLRQAATDCGLDPAAFMAAMNTPDVAAAVNQDASIGAGFVINGQIPTVYINGKWLPRWKLEGTNILERIVEAAAAGN